MKACASCHVVGKHHPTCPRFKRADKLNTDFSLRAYRRFLKRKVAAAPDYGIPIEPGQIHPYLKSHQRAAVQWAVRGGRRAIFASFGLGKSIMQMETLRLIVAHSGGRGLIVAPLGVRQEFKRDGEKIGVEICFIRSIDDVNQIELFPNETGHPRLFLTNYETVRDGKLDPKEFTAVSLDEAAILSSFGGTKTFREFMRLFEGVPYRFVATATPDPNEFIELLAYAAFLGVMEVGEGKTRFFKRDSTKADKLTLHPHKEEEWWLWCASWGLFLDKPSSLGPEFSDEGYNLPEFKVEYIEVKVDHTLGTAPERDGQERMFRDAMHGVVEAAREKRDTLPQRVEAMNQILAAHPGENFLLWHDLESEREAIERAVPGVVTVYGKQRATQTDLEILEKSIIDFSEGRIQYLGAKPRMFGAGANWQYFCANAIFLGIGFSFRNFIQAIHRIYRFLQSRPVTIYLIYAESEKEILKTLLEKWERHKKQSAAMSEIMQKYGLSKIAMANALMRSLGVERVETAGENYRLVNNDCVEETNRMPENSVDLILTSIPFSTQYEYTPSFNDFGHTDGNPHFFAQMDFLTPQLFKILKPGRICAIHVKDRIVPGGVNGLGFQTVYPFHCDAIAHYQKHGFALIGQKTIVTDVVRENNQTYRLGWTEQCKDGSKMGVGMPEYLLLFRKPPSDSTNAYADEPVVKEKKNFKNGQWEIGGVPVADPTLTPFIPRKTEQETTYEPDYQSVNRVERHQKGYSRSRWQIDAHGFERSSGNRTLTPEDLNGATHANIFKMFREYSLSEVYDFEHHVRLGEHLEMKGILPVTFMLLQPQSWHPDVWTDITRMLTLNGAQSAKGKQMHLCPMQFDIADRVIEQMSQPGETVFDPFAGLGTVPYRAVLKGRKGYGVELNAAYWLDSASYCKAAEQKVTMPTLFDMLEEETV